MAIEMWIFLGAAAAFAAWRLYGALKTPPRFLRLAYMCADGAVWIVCLVTAVVAISGVLSPDDSVVGSPIGFGGDGVHVTAARGVFAGDGTSPGDRARNEELFGSGARVPEGDQVEILVRKPSSAFTVAAVATALLSVALLVVGLVRVRRILRRALEGRPFDLLNAHDLRALGVLILIGAFVLPVAQYGVAVWAISEAGGEGGRIGTSLGFVVPALIGLLVLALGEVWRYGVALQRDAEATV